MKIVVGFPILTVIIGYLLSGTSAQYAAYNWWYVAMLPITLSIISVNIIIREKNTGYQNVLCLGNSLKKVYFSKIMAIAVLLFVSNMVIWIGCMILGIITKVNITPQDGLRGTVLLILSFLWQIPVIMFWAKKIGYLPAIMVSFGMNEILSFIGTEKNWFLFNPYAIPARIVGPYFHLHQNGLTLESSSFLLDKSVVLPATGLSLLLGIFLLLITMNFFARGENNV